MTHSMNILYVMRADLNNIKILGQVIKFAQQHQASLTLLDVIESLPASSRMLVTSVPAGELRDSVVRDRLAQLEELILRIGSGTDELRPCVLFGNHAKTIAREAEQGGYDLVIKSPEEGRTDRHLLQNCDCPVWLLTPDNYDSAGQIISSHSPLFTSKEEKLAVDSRLAYETKSHVNWVSRAQDLFRLS